VSLRVERGGRFDRARPASWSGRPTRPRPTVASRSAAS